MHTFVRLHKQGGISVQKRLIHADPSNIEGVGARQSTGDPIYRPEEKLVASPCHKNTVFQLAWSEGSLEDKTGLPNKLWDEDNLCNAKWLKLGSGGVKMHTHT